MDSRRVLIVGFGLLMVILYLTCKVVMYHYHEHNIVETQLFGNRIKLGVSADRTIHADVNISPQDVVDGGAAVLFPKLYVMKKGYDYLKTQGTFDKDSDLPVFSEETKQALRDKSNMVKEILVDTSARLQEVYNNNKN